MRFLLCAAVTATLLAAGPAAAQDDDNKLYKWVDEDGNVTYQDQPPPGESGQVQTFEASGDESADSSPETAMPDVDLTLYSIEACDACNLVRALLNDRGLPFTEKNAENDVAVQDELREVSGVLSVPVLVIGDEVLTGFNRELILKVLENAGFPTSPGAPRQTETSSEGQLTPEQMEQTARDTVPGGSDDDELGEDIFSDSGGQPAGDDISQWEEIPEDEQIRIGE